MKMEKVIIGIQPTNNITLGNYLGAIRNLVQIQNKYECFVFVADLHAITNDFDPQILKNSRKEVACTYYACGLDIQKACLFYQSAVHTHNDLSHILLCHTNLGELNRMTQFKDKALVKAQNNTTLIKTGLLTYPVLMAADILLYDANLVVVGADQKQHIELTRNIAQRMNNKYGDNLFIAPKEFTISSSARIMDLQNPSIKMSKSSKDHKGVIFLTDSYEQIQMKIMKAKTDLFNKINYDLVNQPGISNLIDIYQSLTNLSQKEIVQKYQDISNYGVFKKDLIEIIWKVLSPIQEKLKYARDNFDQIILPILKANAKKCTKIVNIKTNQVYQKIGLDAYEE